MSLKTPFTLLIHIALAIILAGAIVTHFLGIQGEVTLLDGAPAVRTFSKSSGPGDGSFPFSVRLLRADIDFYPGTTTPMDFRSLLRIGDRDVTVSMNKVAEVKGWRFFQSGIAPGSSTLTVSHDPWGTGITYTGYILLGIAMLGYFFQRNTPWRALLGKRGTIAVLLIAFCGVSQMSASGLRAMQRPLAANLGKVYVYWNDRICPMQTMARDVALKLYGAASYEGMTSEQVLSGWLFYFDEWERDYDLHHSLPAGASEKDVRKDAERRALVRWLGTGEAFRIYPYRTASGHMEWLSLAGRKPSKMDFDQWRFMQTTMPDVKAALLEGRNIRANEILSALVNGQRRYAGEDVLPSDVRMRAERFYNSWARPLPASIAALLLGAAFLWLGISGGTSVRFRRTTVAVRTLRRWLAVCVALLFLYVVGIIALLWWIGGHAPLSNGPEMMMFMAFLALAGTLAVRSSLLRGSLLTVAAMTLLVAVMGGRTPQIGMLMPVLGSPLLSVHVMLVMTSYVLFILMAILSAVALCSKRQGTRCSLCRTNRIILLPAVFILTAGIFVGAVWANMSWGRYWGWDPKETCALVMMLIYAVPLHWGDRRLKAFRRPEMLHWYLLIAVVSVLFTYFGANYLLPGLHSYA